MSKEQALVIILFLVIVAFTIMWVITGKPKTIEYHPKYKILENGYGKFTVQYHIGLGVYMTLEFDMNNKVQAYKCIEDHKKDIIKRVNKLVESMD